ncbi:MAG: prepilin-type N-terminal cleavage/methylation domain-containing protein [bacterium]|jgi:prepilin-type N-terminal cleavage/methylation domain-containing protein|nr:prepilin-type N-terminal cleavage/methylation domain-containing protein [bacterium]
MKKKLGFTLIELLIVVAIIGILAAIAVPNFMNAQIRAKLARIESDHRALATALSMYRLDNGRSPRDNFPNHGWFYSWALLTSPVSYMPAVLADVFQADDVNLGFEHRVGGATGKLTYDYGTDEFHGYNGSPTHDWHKAWGNSQWKIGSPGPDQKYQNVTFLFPGAGWVAGAYYDASNGLISPGDIFRCENSFKKDRE